MIDPDVYKPNAYSYELNPEMLELLGKEFDVDKVTSEFAEAVKGKSAEEAESAGKDFFEKHGEKWIRKTYQLGEEYPDRTYEVLKMAIDKTEGHLKFALLPQRTIEIAYLSTQDISILPIIENNPERLVYRMAECETYKNLKEKCGEDIANRLPCRHSCLTACKVLHQDLEIDAKIEMQASIPKEGYCQFAAQRA
ncbi:MAG: hypothetical protein GY866_21975 [Proteobacteria bacterium]|nr:hypothetical protein [Pseudomonadota bacterium]